MNIAVFHDLPAGGALVSAYHFCKYLSQNHNLNLFTIGGQPGDSPFDFSDFINAIFVFGRSQPTSGYRSFLHRLYHDVYALFWEKVIEKEIAQQINRGGYDIAIIFHSRFHQAPFVLRYLKIPSIYYCQEPPRSYYEYNLRTPEDLPLLNKIYEGSLRLIKKKIDLVNARAATAIAVNSYYSAEVIQRVYGCNAYVTYLGVDPQVFKPKRVRKQNQVLIIGNPEPQKNIELAIEAFSLLEKNIRPKLLAIGPRNFDSLPIKKLAQSLGVDYYQRFGLGPSEMARQYSLSLLTLATAYLEPFGLSVIESMSCQTPVVAVKEGGFKEIITHRKTGYLVDRDKDQLARVIERLIKNPPLCRTMGKAGREDVLARWTWDKASKRLENVAVSLVAG